MRQWKQPQARAPSVHTWPSSGQWNHAVRCRHATAVKIKKSDFHCTVIIITFLIYIYIYNIYILKQYPCDVGACYYVILFWLRNPVHNTWHHAPTRALQQAARSQRLPYLPSLQNKRNTLRTSVRTINLIILDKTDRIPTGPTVNCIKYTNKQLLNTM